MEAEARFAEIMAVADPDNGDITMFIANEKWGPIVTGATLGEAKEKMSEAFLLSLIANTFWTNDPASGMAPYSVEAVQSELGKVTKTLSHSY